MVWAWNWHAIERMQPLWIISIHEVLYPMAALAALAVGAMAVTRQGWLQTT